MQLKPITNERLIMEDVMVKAKYAAIEARAKIRKLNKDLAEAGLLLFNCDF